MTWKNAWNFYKQRLNPDFIINTLRKAKPINMRQLVQRMTGICRPAIHYILFGNVFIAICAVVMCYLTELLFATSHNFFFLAFVFFASLSSYNLHASFNKGWSAGSVRLNWILTHKSLLLASFLISGAATAIAFIPLAGFYLWIIPVSILSFLYSLPRIIRTPGNILKTLVYFKTLYLAVIWTFVTVALPLIIHRISPRPGQLIFMSNRFFLIFLVSILFEYRERNSGIPRNRDNFIGRMNEAGFDSLFYLLSLLFLITAGFGFQGPFSFTGPVSAVLPLILLLSTYSKSKSTRSDYWFYLFVDGMLMMQGILMIAYSALH